MSDKKDDNHPVQMTDSSASVQEPVSSASASAAPSASVTAPESTTSENDDTEESGSDDDNVDDADKEAQDGDEDESDGEKDESESEGSGKDDEDDENNTQNKSIALDPQYEVIESDSDDTPTPVPPHIHNVKAEPSTDEKSFHAANAAVSSSSSSSTGAPLAVTGAAEEDNIDIAAKSARDISVDAAGSTKPAVALPLTQKSKGTFGCDESSSSDDSDDERADAQLKYIRASKKLVEEAMKALKMWPWVPKFADHVLQKLANQKSVLFDELRLAKLAYKQASKTLEESKARLKDYKSLTKSKDREQFLQIMSVFRNEEYFVQRLEGPAAAADEAKYKAECNDALRALDKSEYHRLAFTEWRNKQEKNRCYNEEGKSKAKFEQLCNVIKITEDKKAVAKAIQKKAHLKDGSASSEYLDAFKEITTLLGDLLKKAARVMLRRATDEDSISGECDRESRDYKFREDTAFDIMYTYSPLIGIFFLKSNRLTKMRDFIGSDVTAKRIAQLAAQSSLHETAIELCEKDAECKEWLEQSIYGVFLYARLKHAVESTKPNGTEPEKAWFWPDPKMRKLALECFLLRYLSYCNNEDSLRTWAISVSEIADKSTHTEEDRRHIAMWQFFQYFHVGEGTAKTRFGGADRFQNTISNLEYAHGGRILRHQQRQNEEAVAKEKQEREVVYQRRKKQRKDEEKAAQLEIKRSKEADKEAKNAQADWCPLAPPTAASSSSSSISPPKLTGANFNEMNRFAATVSGKSIVPRVASSELYLTEKNKSSVFKSVDSSVIYFYDNQRVHVLPAQLKTAVIQRAIYHVVQEHNTYFLGVLYTDNAGSSNRLWFSGSKPTEMGECPFDAVPIRLKPVFAPKPSVAQSSSSSSSSSSSAEAAMPSTSAAAGGDYLKGKVGGLSVSVVATTIHSTVATSTSTTTTTTTARVVLPTPVPMSADTASAATKRHVDADAETSPAKRPRTTQPDNSGSKSSPIAIF